MLWEIEAEEVVERRRQLETPVQRWLWQCVRPKSMYLLLLTAAAAVLGLFC